MARQFLVLGVGRFGAALAVELEHLGHEVLAVDRDAHLIEVIAGQVTHAVTADVTDEETLTQLGAADFDTAVVAMGGDERASIFATVLLKRMGVRRVLCKATNPLHADILRMVGADRVIFPEVDTGRRVAHSLHMSAVNEYFDVAPGFGVINITAMTCAGKTVGELGLDGRSGNLLLYVRRGDQVHAHPSPASRLAAGDELTIAGPDNQLEKLRL